MAGGGEVSFSSEVRVVIAGPAGCWQEARVPRPPQQGARGPATPRGPHSSAGESGLTSLPFFFLVGSLNTFLISSHYFLPK